MKRGLKCATSRRRHVVSVKEDSPMKRGLKCVIAAVDADLRALKRTPR